MNIYNRTQIRSWDAYSVIHEPISSTDLMERAAMALYGWFCEKFSVSEKFICFCGSGNNGGDGFALSRLLAGRGHQVKVLFSVQGSMSSDCRINYDRFLQTGGEIREYDSKVTNLEIEPESILIDALYGTGLTRPLDGASAEIVHFINRLPNRVISIDMPSGLPADGLVANDAVIQADFTLTFQCPKYSFFLPEHETLLGEWRVLNIGLHKGFEEMERTPYAYVDEQLADFFKPPARRKHDHKGVFGHAVLFGGSSGMLGAINMAARSCLRSGAGLCSLAVPEEGLQLLQGSVPEAMCVPQSQWMNHMFFSGKTAVGAGMGWALDDYHGKLLQWLLSNVTSPLLLDASALHLLSAHMDWLSLRPEGAVTILTPHIGEFNRMCGKSINSVDRIEKAKTLASQYGLFVVLKGAYTQVITPGGLVYFNSTGNPGMAKGGSGDVLAGLITGLLAQQMPPPVACLAGVYVHGLAGDLAASKFSQQGMTAVDLVTMLPEAWKKMMD